MPRYYFHINRAGVWEKDQERIEFPSFEAVYGDALQAAREMVVEQALSTG